ncbi:MAG: ABC transporter substrate-binding protein [Desulfovermiculus sp.]|nr:ABC transporter substrate-binding protein [Desulfovermiculus sp.]
MKSVKNLCKVASLFVGMLAILCSSVYAEETIKVGVVGPRTGGAAATGKAFEEGIELALDKINGSGGVLGKKMEVVFEDTAGDPAKAASGLEKLITKDNIVMAVGESHSSAALAEIDVANRYETPLIIAEAWHDDITAKGYKYVFRAGPANSGVVNENIIEFIKDYGFKKVAIVAENTDWGLGIKDLAEAGLKKADIPFKTVITERKGQDHYTELTKIMNFEPDLMLAFVYGFGVHYLISQANELGLFPGKALILEGAGPPSLWPEFWQTVGDAGNLELFVSRMHPEVQFTEVTKEYQEAYIDKFGKSPSDYKSRSIYDTLLIAADAINRAGSKDPDKLVEALENTKLIVGSGVVQFGTTPGSYAYHQWQPPMLIIQWQDREQVVVYPKRVATGELKR